MITNETGAYQEMCAAVRAVVTSAGMLAIVGYVPELRYVDIAYKAEPSKDKVWCRISIAQAGEKKRTLSRPSRVTQHGMVDVQLFVPVSFAKAAETGRQASELLRTAFTQGTPSVDFFGAVIRDMPPESQWFYKRVSATYNYDIREG